jgi:hypothetical protein
MILPIIFLSIGPIDNQWEDGVLTVDITYGMKVQIFERDFRGGRWYLLLPEIHKSSTSIKMLYFKWLSVILCPIMKANGNI